MIKWIVLGVIGWIVMAVLAAFISCFRDVKEFNTPYCVDADAMAEAFAMTLCLWWALFIVWGLQFVFDKTVVVMSNLAMKISKKMKWIRE